MNAIVVQEHNSNYPDPISFKSKEILKLGAEDKQYPGWIWVVTTDGNEGWAPVEYLELTDAAGQAVARLDYCARELDVKKGQRLRIENGLCGWCLVTNSSSDSGWVPRECLRLE